MRGAVLLPFLLCFGGVSSAQLELAPNPACPNNAGFCRMAVQPANGNGVSVLGVNNNVLYGYQLGDSTHPILIYTATAFAPEVWSLPPHSINEKCVSSPQFCDTPIEIVFGSGTCSGFKYIYTDFQRILRAKSDPADWNFKDLGSSNLPGIPLHTGGRPGSFAIG